MITKDKIKNLFNSFLDKWETDIYDWLRKQDKKSQLILFFVIACIISFFSLPDSVAFNLPASKKDIGQIMKFSVRAERDYLIVDEDATKKSRIDAQSQIPEHYITIDNSTYYTKLRNAFKTMRQFADDITDDAISKKKGDLPPEFKTIYRESVKRFFQNSEFTELDNQIQDTLAQNKSLFDKEIGIPIDDTIFSMLRESLFSSEVEKSLFGVLSYLENYFVYRSASSFDSSVKNISIKKGETITTVPLNKVITEKKLFAEIEHAQKVLGASVDMTEKGLALSAVLAYWLVKDNINFSPELTEKKKLESWNSVTETVFSIKNGEIIRRAGEVITEKDIRIFKEIIKESRHKSMFLIFIEHLLFILIALSAVFLSFQKSIKKFSYKNKDLILMAAQGILSFLFWDMIVSLSIPFSQWMGNIDARIFYFLLPFPFAVATVRLLINSETALFFLFASGVLFLTKFPDNYYYPAFYSISSLFYLYLITHIEKRSTILRISFFLAIFQMVLTVVIFLLDFTLPSENILRAMLISFLGAMFSGFLVLGIVPFWEWLLGYTTDITFLEFSSLNHPLMKRMAVYANGTYQHSLAVGSIVETAAREIRLSPLACKVLAYFHDIGKLERPEYFSENQTGKNKHDDLTPTMSAMVIINHIKKGVELAREHKLGEKIEEAVGQHHGTSLIKYFYAKAKALDPNVSEEIFRYPGPMPTTREVGLLMLADSVEAAVRSMPEKNYQKISDAVHNIITKIVEDGQLSHCNMTMQDLALIEKSFIKTLSGIYHARIEYPDPVA